MSNVGDGAMMVIGWREWLALPELGIPRIKAKSDTGARSSALHVETLESFERDGERWVRFTLLPRSRKRRRVDVVEARVVDVRPVTDSGGNRQLRPFIRTELVIGTMRYPIEMSLTNRQAMLFPMLLGRTAMAGRLQVDPTGSFLLGRPRRNKSVIGPPP